MHVAIIPDGNRRWAKHHGLPFIAGHRAGSLAWQAILESDDIDQINWLTFWGASIDNLTKRSPDEVEGLLTLFDLEFDRLAKDQRIHRQRTRVRVIGDWASYLHPNAQQNIARVMAATAEYDRRNLTLLIAYDGLKAMVDSIQSLVKWSSDHRHQTVTAEVVQQNLITRALPPVDLLLRTGGEPHLSAGFLMWEMANAQLIFWDKLWPDISPTDISHALEEHHQRTRRFGA